MSFWNKFIQKTDNKADVNSLVKDLEAELADLSEEKQIEVTCVAGLLARVAYVDFEIDPNEIENMSGIISKWTDLNDEIVSKITETALKHVKALAGLENHLYLYPLRDILNRDQRYSLIEALFAIAAADGNVENLESEEIRVICTGLELGHQHFISARAKVLGSLGALKNN